MARIFTLITNKKLNIVKYFKMFIVNKIKTTDFYF